MKKIIINRYILAVFAAMIFVGLTSSNTIAQVKGPNVTKVEVGNAGVEGTVVQTGPKTWTSFQNNGGLSETFTETGRDEWSVYLTSPKFSSVIINLFQKTFVIKQGSNIVYSGKILSSSDAPIGSAAAANSGAGLEQQCFDAIQGKVAYDQAGNKWWGASDVQKLCAGTTNTAATIACFQAEIKSHNSWSRGIEACKVNPTVARAAVANTSNTAVTTATRSAVVETSRPSPLTPNQMSKMMEWIAVKTSAARLPFCWRRSFGRGAGVLKLCPEGYVKEGLICFTPCKANENGVDDICYQNCPAGFRNDGLYCGKPAAYGRGVGYPWKSGDKAFSLDGARARCTAANPEGCEQYGAIIYPKCRAGFKNAGSNVCSPICPSGFTDIGVSCKKPESRRKVAYTSRCRAGLVKDPTGEFCYPACDAGKVPGYQKVDSGSGDPKNYKGVGPVCWQNCPSQQSVDCGAGCATTKGACAKSVLTMTTAPIIAAVKIAALVVTFGGSSAATGSAGAAVGGGKLIANSPKLIKLAQLADKLQRFAKTYKDTIKAVTTTKTVVLALKSEIEIFATEFAANFGEMTSPEIEKEIDARFSKEAAFEVKKEWGRHHAGLMLEANAINTAYNVLSIAGIADPTGLVGVVSAFTNPLCRNDTPFPDVNPKY